MKAILLATAAIVLAAPAVADDFTINPWTAELDSLNLTVGGMAHGTLFTNDMPAGAGAPQHWATGAVDVNLKLERMYDSGLSLALKSSFEVLRDRLSHDNYGGNLVQKVYGVAQTGLGRIEIGMTDGAGYALAVTGPTVDDATSIDNANAGFFIDPSTGRDFTEIFALNSAVESSLNYAKISYYTPRLFGIQIAASYTPSEGREVIPFLNNGPNVANRQKSMWETAISYSETFDRISVGLYGSAIFAHGDRKTPGHAGLTEYGLGTQIDYDLTDDMKLSVGGGWRHSNTFAFDIYDARTTGGTQSGHLSSTLTYGPWIFGGEYGNGTADGGTFGPGIGVRGFSASVGYVVNANIQITAGWQGLHYDRNAGAFYTGSQRIEMNAGFVHVKFHV
jgi:hypothetical protein